MKNLSSCNFNSNKSNSFITAFFLIALFSQVAASQDSEKNKTLLYSETDSVAEDQAQDEILQEISEEDLEPETETETEKPMDSPSPIDSEFKAETVEIFDTVLSDPDSNIIPHENLVVDNRPYGQNDKELSIGIGASGSNNAFYFSAGFLFAYYVINQLAPGIDVTYQAIISEYKYPQSITLFPLVKYVLVRSNQIAPYLIAGGGRTFEWGGTTKGIDESTGKIYGFSAVSSWLTGFGGGVSIGMGRNASISIQIMAMYRHFDQPVLRNTKIVLEQRIENGQIISSWSLEGDETKSFWYPAPSFWFSFRL